MKTGDPKGIDAPADGVWPADVLFICTGNYFRSRYAEELFNFSAAEAGSPLRAISRGIRTSLIVERDGPLSPYTVRRLAERGIRSAAPRGPIQLSESDVLSSRMAIALCDREHRPRLESTFPHLRESFAYWHVEDVNPELGVVASANASLDQIEILVADLLRELMAAGQS
jgi:protein-tyrosine phosphatase